MPKSFRVEIHPAPPEDGEEGVPYLVTVRPFGSSRLLGELRVLQLEVDGVSRLRLVWARLTGSDDPKAAHDSLASGRWWERALADVLEAVTFASPAADRAIELAEGRLRYGWVGGEIAEARLVPADSEVDPPTRGAATGEPGTVSFQTGWMHEVISAMRQQVAVDAELTDEVIEDFFTDLALYLAEKAFDREDDAGEDADGDAGQ